MRARAFLLSRWFFFFFFLFDARGGMTTTTTTTPPSGPTDRPPAHSPHKRARGRHDMIRPRPGGDQAELLGALCRPVRRKTQCFRSCGASGRDRTRSDAIHDDRGQRSSGGRRGAEPKYAGRRRRRRRSLARSPARRRAAAATNGGDDDDQRRKQAGCHRREGGKNRRRSSLMIQLPRSKGPSPAAWYRAPAGV